MPLPFLIGGGYMAFTADEIKLLDRMNKRKAVWDKNGMSNNAIEQVDNMLENFYMGLNEEGYNVKNKLDRFTMRKDLTREQEKQLVEIAEYMESMKTSSLGYYNKRMTPTAKKAFDKSKELGYVTGEGKQAYIDFIDFMENSQAIKETVSMLGSKVIARIYGYGKSKGLSDSEINSLILANYKDFKTGDQLQAFVFDSIDRIYEKKQKAENND